MEWKDKMYDEGSNPPKHMWDAISRNIPDRENSRLYDLEFEPPVSCWVHIQGQIIKPKASVFKIKPSFVMRYAAILILGFFISLIALSPSFRTNIINSIQGNKIKAALPSTNQIMDSIQSNKSIHKNTLSK